MRIARALWPTTMLLGCATLMGVASAQTTNYGLPDAWEVGLPLGPGMVLNASHGNAVVRIPVAGWGTSGRGPNANVSLFYNSLAGDAGDDLSGGCKLGAGWSIAFASTLIDRIDATNAELQRSDGSRIAFTKSAGVWSCSSAGFFIELDEEPPSQGVGMGSGPPTPSLRWIATLLNGTVEEFDSLGRLMTIRDASGNELTVAHSQPVPGLPLGTVTTITDAAGRSLEYQYDQGRLKRIVDLHNGLAPWELEYDVNGRLEGVLDIDGTALFGFGYDAAGLADVWTDPDSTDWTFGFDANGRVTSFVDGLGALATGYAYAPSGSGTTLTVTDKRGNDWVYELDSSGRATDVSTPLGHTWLQVYDGDNNLQSSTSPLGHTWSRTYDGSGRMLTQTSPESRVTTRAYDSAGNQDSYQDEESIEWESHFDDLQNPRNATGIDEPADGVSLPIAEHVLSWFGPSTPTSRGRPNELTDDLGVATRLSWDTLGQLDSIEHGLIGASRSVVRDFTWGPFGDLVSTDVGPWSASLPAVPSAPAIPDSPLAGTLDVSGTFRVDWTGALADVSTTIQSPFPGDLPAQRDLSLLRDAIGRTLCETIESDEATVTTSGNGAVVQSTLTWTYDDLAGTLRVDTGASLALEWATDDAGRTTSLSSFQGTTPGPSLSYTYFDDGRLKRVTGSNGTVTDLTWHPDGRLDQKLVHGPSSQLLFALDHDYDTRGRIQSIIEFDGITVSTTTYGYDDRGRLLSEIRVGSFPFELHYAYDQLGNRTQKTEVSGSTTTVTDYTYDVDTLGGVVGHYNHRLLHASTTVGGVASRETWYAYDHSEGHVTYVVSLDAGSTTYQGTRFVYDTNGRLFLTIDEEYSLDTAGDPVNHVVLDAHETRQMLFDVYRRARRDPSDWSLTSDEWTDSVGLLPLADYELDGTGARTDRQLFVGAGAVLDTATSTQVFRHGDRQATERVVTNASGSVAGGGLYTAFGEPIYAVGGTRLGFVGGTGAEASGHPSSADHVELIRTGARYLDANAGRYLMSDPIGVAGGWNTYAYAESQPSGVVDPLGLFPVPRRMAGPSFWAATKSPRIAQEKSNYDNEWFDGIHQTPMADYDEDGSFIDWWYLPPDRSLRYHCCETFRDTCSCRRCSHYGGPSDTMPPVLRDRRYWTGYSYETMPPDLSQSSAPPGATGPRTPSSFWSQLTRLIGEFTSRERPR